MAEVAVINASPLIFFSKSGHMDILSHFADRILVPQPVAEEILRRGPSDITAKAITTTSYIEVRDIGAIPEVIQGWGLGSGESSVIAMALQHGCEAIIDDMAGRRCAASMGVLVRGTLGVVLVAKQRRVIPSARAILEDMIREGLYLSRNILDKALQRVGE